LTSKAEAGNRRFTQIHTDKGGKPESFGVNHNPSAFMLHKILRLVFDFLCVHLRASAVYLFLD